MNGDAHIGGNMAIGWVTFLLDVREQRCKVPLEPHERSLVGQMKGRLKIGEVAWAEAIEAFPGKQCNRLAKLSLGALLEPGKCDGFVKGLVGEQYTYTHLARKLEAYARAVVDKAGALCFQCDAGVYAGVKCDTCRRQWHWGCAMRSLRDSKLNILPSDKAAFATDNIHTFKCLLCRQGRQAPARQSLLERLRLKVERMSEGQAWDLVEEAVAAGPSRRRLPGSDLRRGALSSASFLATAVVTILAELASSGSQAAELLLLHAPRLFMRKGHTVEEQVEQFVEGVFPAARRTQTDNDKAWVAAAESALLDGNLTRLVSVIERGPREERLLRTLKQ
jgi:hypothetical protein